MGGYRCQIIKDSSEVRPYSRHGAEYTVKLWRLQDDGRKLLAGTSEAGSSPAEFVACGRYSLVLRRSQCPAS